jgi:tetratricopeptide (TPR) repeat protein
MDAESLDALLVLRPHDALGPLDAALAAAPAGSFDAEWLHVARAVVRGDYAAALARPLAAELLGPADAASAGELRARARAFLDAHAHAPSAAAFLTWLGVACLHAVARAEFTGPPLDAAQRGALAASASGAWVEGGCAAARALLALDGEEVHRKHAATWALVGARALLPPPPAEPLDPSPWAAWWAARACVVHARLLSAQSPTLRAGALAGLRAALDAASVASGCGCAVDEVRAAALLDECALHALCSFPLELECSHAAALGARALSFDLSGELGFRTRFQSRPFAQLKLCATRVSSAGAAARPWHGAGGAAEELPREVETEDDTLLAHAQREPHPDGAPAAAPAAEAAAGAPAAAAAGGAPPPPPAAALTRAGFACATLYPCDQALALVSAELARLRTRAGADGERVGAASQDEPMVFLNLITAAPLDWPLQAAALRRRAALDALTKRRQLRALAQLEELAAAPERAAPSASVRVSAWFWGSLPPSRRETQLEYGRALAALGALGEAVAAFRAAGAEEEAAIALAALGDRDAAIAIVTEALADGGSATAGLHCTLGDLTGDEAHYRDALAFAGGRHFRAVRAAGRGGAGRGPAVCVRVCVCLRVCRSLSLRLSLSLTRTRTRL